MLEFFHLSDRLALLSSYSPQMFLRMPFGAFTKVGVQSLEQILQPNDHVQFRQSLYSKISPVAHAVDTLHVRSIIQFNLPCNSSPGTLKNTFTVSSQTNQFRGQ